MHGSTSEELSLLWYHLNAANETEIRTDQPLHFGKWINLVYGRFRTPKKARQSIGYKTTIPNSTRPQLDFYERRN